MVCGEGRTLNQKIGGNEEELNTAIDIFKNEVLYETRRIGAPVSIPVITMPTTFTEDKIEEYVINVLKPYYQNASSEGYIFDENSLKLIKGAEDIGIIKDVNISDVYTVSIRVNGKEENESWIIIRKEQSEPITSTDKKTNIKIEISTNIVPSDTIMEAKEIKEENIIKIVKKSLKEISNKFVSYDITLQSKGVSIQPNGKVKINIPIPTGYNKGKLVVYRVDEKGNKVRYEVSVSGNYATFETDHFSTYVLAEETNTIQNTEERKKDETPKTGIINMTGYLGITIVIAVLGILVFKKNKID